MVSDEKMSWEELLEEYFLIKNLKPDTEHSYRKVVRLFNEFMGGNSWPGDVTARDIQRWRRHMLKVQGRSTNTWNNRVSHLRPILALGIRKKWLPQTENPLDDASVPGESKKKKTLTEKQMIKVYLTVQNFAEAEVKRQVVCDRMRNAMYPPWYWLTVLDVLRFTGMRFNQLKHIRLKDVHEDEAVIALQLEGSKTRREWSVPIVTPLQISLKHLLACARANGAMDDDYLFDVCLYSEHYGPGKYKYCARRAHQSVRSFFRRLSRECGFNVSPHRFRHTLATKLMEAPERNLHMVKSILGHRSVATTMEYVDLSLKVAAQTLEAELSLSTDEGTKRRIHEARKHSYGYSEVEQSSDVSEVESTDTE
ncbi:tyrosine-type recombinase/integrase [Escherichia coli]|nr:site-specific integrase [Escherichia coli]MEB5733092.1 tyrosine-type recombinase/integrase [Escherichia coli]HAW7763368.1 site-specific integrase [Escherichia coli]HAW8173122.1 site-specific integrase [Escherichia coli]HAW8247381.1 site-specific integrase [Escherichia coli]